MHKGDNTMVKKLIKKLKSHWANIPKNLAVNKLEIFKPIYRVVRIEKNKHNDYEVAIQIIGKNTFFKMKPEKILADDKMTDLFSPRDIRTLTYLGYLDINSPKYRILAKRLSEGDNKMLFALIKKGDKIPTVKTASEISQEQDILSQIDQKDAHMIGYTAASEAMLDEKLEKERLLHMKDTKNQIGKKN